LQGAGWTRRGVGNGEWLAFLVSRLRAKCDFRGVGKPDALRDGSARFRLRPPPAASLASLLERRIGAGRILIVSPPPEW